MHRTEYQVRVWHKGKCVCTFIYPWTFLERRKLLEGLRRKGYMFTILDPTGTDLIGVEVTNLVENEVRNCRIIQERGY